jgi:hypothetical protein
MAKSIVQVLTQQELLDLFRKEANIDNDGKVEFTRRGVARLVGKDKVQIQRLLSKCCSGGDLGKKPLSQSLQPFAGMDFSGGDKISDAVAWGVVNHYAFDGDSRCQDLLLAIGAIGLRVTVQNAQHWQSDRSATQQLAWKYILD